MKHDTLRAPWRFFVGAFFVSLLLAGNASSVRAELVTYLPMDGELVDEGPGGNDGAFYGDLDPLFVEGFDGTPEGAISLDGVDDYVLLDANDRLPIAQQPAFTIAMWVKGGPQTDKRVFSESSSTNANPLFNIGTHNTAADGTVDAYIREGTPIIRDHTHSTQTAFDDTWHHIAWVDDNMMVTLYVDGKPDPTVFNYTRRPVLTDLTTIGGIFRPTNATPVCCAFFGAIDDVRLYDHALSAAEVGELVPGGGCPTEGDTICDDISVLGPPGGAPGLYTVESFDAEDQSGDPIIYTFTADDGAGTVLSAGPQAESFTEFDLAQGTWTVSVVVDDDLACDDALEFATCSREVTVVCPDEGDTSCSDLEVEGPADDVPGTYTVTVTGVDQSGDGVYFTFTADNGEDPPIVFGPALGVDTAEFTLGPGAWSLSVEVDDNLLCDDTAANAVCSTTLTIVAAAPVLVSHWTLDGTLDDEQPSANDGEFLGDVAPDYIEGFDGADPGSILFDGVQDLVNVFQEKGLPITANKAYTVAMWVKGLPKVAPLSDLRVFSEANTLSAAGGSPAHPFGINGLFNIGTDNTGATGALDIFIRVDGGQAVVPHLKTARDAFDDTWHHVAWVDDDGDAKVYIDAVRDQTSFRYTRAPLTVNNTTIGGILRGLPTHWFDGAIDDVRVFNYALSQTQVEDLVPPPSGCPGAGDTTCSGLTIVPAPRNYPGIYTLSALGAQDTSGDPILYTFVAETADGDYVQLGPDVLDTVDMQLGAGEWTISVTVDDDLLCRDKAAEAVCTEEVSVVTPPKVLVSHWTFDGDLIDIGEAENDGQMLGLNPPTFGEDRDGNADAAICLPGVADDFVRPMIVEDLPIYTNPVISGYTIAMWVKGPAGQTDRRLYSESNTQGLGNPLFNIGTHNTGVDGTVDLFIRPNTGAVAVNHAHSQGIAFDDTWHHIAWVDANGDAVLYVDGERDATDFSYVKPTAMTLDATTIGGIYRQTGASHQFLGCIDDVRVYNYALTAEEVLDVYNGEGGPTGTKFLRGDANADGTLNITDGIFVLNYLFLGGATPSCLEAANGNGDADINITDGIFVLNYLFLGGGDPPAPGPNTCGVDPRGDQSLGCVSFPGCNP